MKNITILLMFVSLVAVGQTPTATCDINCATCINSCSSTLTPTPNGGGGGLTETPTLIFPTNTPQNQLTPTPTIIFYITPTPIQNAFDVLPDKRANTGSSNPSPELVSVFIDIPQQKMYTGGEKDVFVNIKLNYSSFKSNFEKNDNLNYSIMNNWVYLNNNVDYKLESVDWVDGEMLIKMRFNMINYHVGTLRFEFTYNNYYKVTKYIVVTEPKAYSSISSPIPRKIFEYRTD